MVSKFAELLLAAQLNFFRNPLPGAKRSGTKLEFRTDGQGVPIDPPLAVEVEVFAPKLGMKMSFKTRGQPLDVSIPIVDDLNRLVDNNYLNINLRRERLLSFMRKVVAGKAEISWPQDEPFDEWFPVVQANIRSFLTIFEGSPVHFKEGADLSREFIAGNRLIIWLSQMKRLSQEFTGRQGLLTGNKPSGQLADGAKVLDPTQKLESEIELVSEILAMACRHVTLDSSSLFIAMWWWFRNHLPGEAGSTEGTQIPLNIPGMDVVINACDVWPRVGEIIPMDLQGRPVTGNYTGPQLWVELPGGMDMWRTFSEGRQVEEVVRLRELWQKADAYMNEVMSAHNQPISPFEQAMQPYSQAQTTPPANLFTGLVAETQAWYRLVLEVFRGCQKEQEQIAQILRPLLAGIMLSLSFRAEGLRRRDEQRGGAEAMPLDASLEEERHTLSVIAAQLEFFLQMLLLWEWESLIWIELLQGAILRFLPPRGRPEPQFAHVPGVGNYPPVVEPVEVGEAQDADDGPHAAEDLDAGPDGGIDLSQMTEIDLKDPSVLAQLMHNPKFEVYIVRFQSKRVYKPLGWFRRNNYLLFFVRSRSGRRFACLVSPEAEHADYWFEIDEVGEWVTDTTMPRWKARLMARTLVRTIENPGARDRVIHDIHGEWVDWQIKFLEEN